MSTNLENVLQVGAVIKKWLSALHCKVAVYCVLLYFKYCILGGANTYLPDIFYKIKYCMFQAFALHAMRI